MEIQTTRYMLILANKLINEWIGHYGKVMPNSNEIVLRKSLWIEYQDQVVYINSMINKDKNESIKTVIVYEEDKETYRLVFKYDINLYCMEIIHESDHYVQWQFAKTKDIVRPLSILLNGIVSTNAIKEIEIIDYDTLNLKQLKR